jgi:hypothetical protein
MRIATEKELIQLLVSEGWTTKQHYEYSAPFNNDVIFSKYERCFYITLPRSKPNRWGHMVEEHKIIKMPNLKNVPWNYDATTCLLSNVIVAIRIK